MGHAFLLKMCHMCMNEIIQFKQYAFKQYEWKYFCMNYIEMYFI